MKFIKSGGYTLSTLVNLSTVMNLFSLENCIYNIKHYFTNFIYSLKLIHDLWSPVKNTMIKEIYEYIALPSQKDYSTLPTFFKQSWLSGLQDRHRLKSGSGDNYSIAC